MYLGLKSLFFGCNQVAKTPQLVTGTVCLSLEVRFMYRDKYPKPKAFREFLGDLVPVQNSQEIYGKNFCSEFLFR
jgi:hypothetical protein